MKVSELTTEYMGQYLRVDDIDIVRDEIKMELDGAISYIKNITGYNKKEMDKYAELTCIIMAMVGSMFSSHEYVYNSTKTINSNINKMLESFLSAHILPIIATSE